MRSVVLPRMARSALAMIALALAACGDPAARVALAPLGGDCARPLGANAVEVIAYTASGERVKAVALTESVAISDFPADTEQIGVEVLVGGGAIGAEGKSVPLAFGALADGAKIPVMMAPPDGFCELAGMTEARAQPLIARAGDGALVVGGMGASGPLSTAEYYDPATATFAPVEVPTALADQGFTGTTLASLPDGRVAVIGGPHAALVVFDPARRAFVTAPTLIDAWLFAAAIAVGDQEVLVAGGCSTLTGTKCVSRLQTRRYQLSKLSTSELSVILTPGPRVSPRLFDLGIQLDGKRRYLLAGGSTEVGSGAVDHADRFTLDDDSAEAVPGGHAQAAALDGGAVLTAFGDDSPAVAPDGTAAVYAPDAAAFLGIASAPAQRDTRLIALEDGRVMAFGGDMNGRVLTYDPTRNAWTAAVPAMSGAETGQLTQPSLARLGDGTILVVGGAVSQRAWVYRPSLVGPASGSVTATPAGDLGVVTAPDPATVTRTANPPAWQLATPAGATMARALVGGPRMAVGVVRASVHVASGGVALIAQQTGPGQAIVAELAPGVPPRLVRLEAGAEHVVCSATSAQTFDPAAPVTLQLAIRDHDARLQVGDREVLACGLTATDRGAWGIASLGVGAQLTVDTITVARGQPAT